MILPPTYAESMDADRREAVGLFSVGRGLRRSVGPSAKARQEFTTLTGVHLALKFYPFRDYIIGFSPGWR